MSKLTSIFCSFFLLLSGIISAQAPDYYTGKDTISGKGFSYKIMREKGFLVLENIRNIYFEKDNFWHWIKKEKVPESFLNANNYTVAIKENFFNDLFKKAIPKKEFDLLRKIRYEGIDLFFCTDLKGNILEVKFRIPEGSPMLSSVSPERLYKFEQLLKKEHKYRVLEEVQDVVSFAKGIRETLFFRKLY